MNCIERSLNFVNIKNTYRRSCLSAWFKSRILQEYYDIRSQAKLTHFHFSRLWKRKPCTHEFL